jgi:integrase
MPLGIPEHLFGPFRAREGRSRAGNGPSRGGLALPDGACPCPCAPAEAVAVASVNWRKRGNRYLVYWRADDGSQGGKTVDTEEQARLLQARMLLELASGTWTARQRAKLPLAHWDAEWWQLWSAEPDRSPATLAATESRRRLHVLPQLGRRPLEAITPKVLRQWQNQLASKVGYETVMACRSIAYRILKFAEDEGAIPANPMRKVPAPDPPVDPDEIFGDGRRRAYTPEEAGQLLAYFPDFWWDHVITLLGTGMRFGEFAGLHKRRFLDRARPVVQVVDTRYEAGKFGSGFKPRPKSRASVREIPLARQVVEAIRRQMPPNAGPDTLVFTGPGGGNNVKAGTRTVLSRDNFRRTYHGALAKLADPAAVGLRPTAKRALTSLRTAGPATTEELAARLGVTGRKLKPATVEAAVHELQAAGLASLDGASGPACWQAPPPPGNELLEELELHGPHDFRHTLSTWLEDAGIPARVIDEIMGHQSGHSSRRSQRDSGSRIGTRYRHTTPEMAGRVVGAIEDRLAIVVKVAEQMRREAPQPNP